MGKMDSGDVVDIQYSSPVKLESSIVAGTLLIT